MIFKEKFLIGLKDIEKEGKVKNRALLEYLEDIAAMHSAQVGYGVNDIEKTKLTWILLEWKLQVIKRPKYGQTLNIETWARYTNKCYSYRDFEIYDDNNELCAIATSKWLLIDIGKNRPIKIEEELIQKYNPEYGKSVFNILELEKIKEPEDVTTNFTYKVNRFDIDINKHMHNLNYINLAYEALPEEVYENEEFNVVRISYKKEVKLGDILICKYKKENQKHVIVIKSEDEKTLHAIIELE